MVTPRLGLNVTTDVAGAIRLGAEAIADLLTIDTATGRAHRRTTVEIVATATGSGVTTLPTCSTPVPSTSARCASVWPSTRLAAGARPAAQRQPRGPPPRRARPVHARTPSWRPPASSPVISSAAALDDLGDAGADLKALIGLVPTGGMAALDPAHLLTNPLGTLADWWHDLLTNHAADLPAVLVHLRDLVAGPGQVVRRLRSPTPASGPGRSRSSTT